jgi:hypothetical protein
MLKVNRVSLTEHHEAHQRLRSIHGPVGQGEWQHTQEQAVVFIENRMFSYYLLKDSRAVRLVVGRTAAGEKFLKAEPDGDTPDLLLQLPSILPANKPTPLP